MLKLLQGLSYACIILFQFVVESRSVLDFSACSCLSQQALETGKSPCHQIPAPKQEMQHHKQNDTAHSKSPICQDLSVCRLALPKAVPHLLFLLHFLLQPQISSEMP